MMMQTCRCRCGCRDVDVDADVDVDVDVGVDVGVGGRCRCRCRCSEVWRNEGGRTGEEDEEVRLEVSKKNKNPHN